MIQIPVSPKNTINCISVLIISNATMTITQDQRPGTILHSRFYQNKGSFYVNVMHNKEIYTGHVHVGVRQWLRLLLWRSSFKGDSFLHRSAVTPPPQDNDDEGGRKQQRM